MSEQDSIQPSTRLRRSRKASVVSNQNDKQAATMQRPANNDKDAWKEYWQQQGQLWRREPEIDKERQEYLDQRRRIRPDKKQSIYPFKNIKLNRADVEWLLATHENGRGPVDWNDERQRKREGLDLRGADLSQEDLSDLPLACMQGGQEIEWVFRSTVEGGNMVAVLMEEADLGTEERGNTAAVLMEKANLRDAQLQNAFLHRAQLQGADLYDAQLQNADLGGAQLQKANLYWAQLQNADLGGTQLQEAQLHGAQLQNAQLYGAQLQKANLYMADLQNAFLDRAQLQEADLRGTKLDGVNLKEAALSDGKYGTALLADVKWGETNLALVDWSSVKILGDERLANQRKDVEDYRAAVRANRQLAVVLRNQGLNEEADRFAYRAQKLQRQVLQQQLLQRLKKRGEILREQGSNIIGFDRLSGTMIAFMYLLRLPAILLMKFEQIQKDFFLKLFILLLLQLLLFLYLLSLPILLFLIVLVFVFPMLWIGILGLMLLRGAFLLLEFLPKQGHQRLQAILNVLKVEQFRQEVLSESRQSFLIPQLFFNTMIDYGQYTLSLLLDLLAGYGYKPGRSLFIYLLAIGSFAIGYYEVTHFLHAQPYPLAWYEALILSISSFHGRGFFQPVQSLGDPVAILASIEAILGLLIEISFIATFTQRFFGK
jgi:uncharacterized protein YjbI with pentapeptide repeats